MTEISVPVDPAAPEPTTLVGLASRQGSRHLLNADAGSEDRNGDVTAVVLIDGMGQKRPVVEFARHEAYHAARVASRRGAVNSILSVTEAASDTTVEYPTPNGVMATAVARPGQPTVIAHVGDVRAYEFVDEDLTLLTVDHNQRVRILEQGGSKDDAVANAHVVTNSIARATLGSISVVESFAACVLLVSDGLYRVVDHERMREIVAKHGREPQTCADALVVAAEDADGPDDATAVVLYVQKPARRGEPGVLAGR